MEDEEVALVDGVFEGAFGALGEESCCFGDGVNSLMGDAKGGYVEQSSLSLKKKTVGLLRRSGDVVILMKTQNDEWMMMRLSDTPFEHHDCWDLKDFKDSYYCSVCVAGYKDTTTAELQLIEDLLLSRG
ncbi:hypothetical protein Tco_1361098 [Tanacetum coccineum]